MHTLFTQPLAINVNQVGQRKENTILRVAGFFQIRFYLETPFKVTVHSCTNSALWVYEQDLDKGREYMAWTRIFHTMEIFTNSFM